MKPPTAVTIGSHQYTIEWPDNVTDEADNWLYGQTRARYALIRVSHDAAPSQRRDTLLHELIHAALSDAPHGLDSEQEERVIRALTPGLLGIIRDNRALIRYLQEGAAA